MDATRSFEWNGAKAEANLAKHGVSFEEATAIFLDPARADFDASHAEDGEARRKAVGSIGGYVFTVVYTLRSGAIRMISARRANALEVRHYGNR